MGKIKIYKRIYKHPHKFFSTKTYHTNSKDIILSPSRNVSLKYLVDDLIYSNRPNEIIPEISEVSSEEPEPEIEEIEISFEKPHNLEVGDCGCRIILKNLNLLEKIIFKRKLKKETKNLKKF